MKRAVLPYRHQNISCGIVQRRLPHFTGRRPHGPSELRHCHGRLQAYYDSATVAAMTHDRLILRFNHFLQPVLFASHASLPCLFIERKQEIASIILLLPLYSIYSYPSFFNMCFIFLSIFLSSPMLYFLHFPFRFIAFKIYIQIHLLHFIFSLSFIKCFPSV